MPLYKATMAFAATPYGWTESFFTSAADKGAALASLRSLAVKRIGLLGDGADLVGLEIATPGAFRDTLVGFASGPKLPQVTSMPYKGIRVKLENAENAAVGPISRSYLIRGIPDAFILDSFIGPTGFDPAILGRVNDYLAALRSGKWLLKGYDKTSPSYKIRLIQPLAEDDTDIIGNVVPGTDLANVSSFAAVFLQTNAVPEGADPATGFPATVGIRGVKWTDAREGKRLGINGEHPVFATAAGLVVFQMDYPLAGQYARGGFAQIKREILVAIAQTSVVGVGKEKTGSINSLKINAPRSAVLVDAFVGPPAPAEPIVVNPGPWNITPGDVTLNNLQDLFNWFYAGYAPQPGGIKTPIVTAPIVNVPHTWVMGLIGTTDILNPVTGVPTDLAAFLGIPNIYLFFALNVLKQTIPVGDKVWIAGHSLGGMVAQYVCNGSNNVGPEMVGLLDFGSPFTCFTPPSVKRINFAMIGDPVVELGMFALIFSLMKHPELTYIDPDGLPNTWFDRHSGYGRNPFVAQRNPDGSLIQQVGPRPWQLGVSVWHPAPFQ